MIVAGIDIGSRAAKVVILQDNTIISSAIHDTGADSIKTAHNVIAAALTRVNLTLGEVKYTVATGYGRVLVPFANENISEISCHARGITFYFPRVRTILDMGGQDCKAINCDSSGNVTNFVMNDKCAGGTGRFLEMIADVLNVPLAEIGELSLSASTSVPFNTICAVFARSDAIKYLRQGVKKNEILAGLHEAIAARCLNLLKRVSIEPEFTITGGIAKNKGMVRTLAKAVGLEPLLCPDPQLAGALGAALFARERLGGKTSRAMKAQYGYSDGTGTYFISINGELCNGCGRCVTACRRHIFTMDGTQGKPVAVVAEEVRKKLSSVCPGLKACEKEQKNTCHDACEKKAIEHSW